MPDQGWGCEEERKGGVGRREGGRSGMGLDVKDLCE